MTTAALGHSRPRGKSYAGVPTYQAALLCVGALAAIGVACYASMRAGAAVDQAERDRAENVRLVASNAEMTTRHASAISDLEKSLASTRDLLRINEQAARSAQHDLAETQTLLTQAEKKLAYYETAAPWRTRAAWDRLRTGMTEEQAQKTLGDAPQKTTVTESLKGHGDLNMAAKINPTYRWLYPGGAVVFSSQTHLVESWELPAGVR